MNRCTRVAIVALSLLLAVMAAQGWADGTGVGARVGGRPLLLHPAFTRVRGAYLVADDPVSGYVFIGGAPYAAGSGILIDTQTDHRRLVSAPGCAGEAVGGMWLALVCGTVSPQLEIYNISTGRTQPLPGVPSPACGEAGCVSVTAIGTRWAAVQSPTGDPHTLPSVGLVGLGRATATDAASFGASSVDLTLARPTERCAAH